jgi:hypothetical protein
MILENFFASKRSRSRENIGRARTQNPGEQKRTKKGRELRSYFRSSIFHLVFWGAPFYVPARVQLDGLATFGYRPAMKIKIYLNLFIS